MVLPDKSDIYLINLTDTNILLSSLQSSKHPAMVFPLPRLLKFPCTMCRHQFYSCDSNLQKGRWEYLAFIGISIINKRSEVTDFPRLTGQRDIFPLKIPFPLKIEKAAVQGDNLKLGRHRYCSSRTQDRYKRVDKRQKRRNFFKSCIHTHFGEKGFLY